MERQITQKFEHKECSWVFNTKKKREAENANKSKNAHFVIFGHQVCHITNLWAVVGCSLLLQSYLVFLLSRLMHCDLSELLITNTSEINFNTHVLYNNI